MQLFYTPNLHTDEYTLDEPESKHCVKVLRMKEGDNIHLTNGKGTLFVGRIVQANLKACKLEVIEKLPDYEKRNFYLHLAIAPTKNNDRYEWFLEKATEIGANEITPLITENSERRKINNDRFERIIISAMKQSVKAFKPVLNEAITFQKFIVSAKGLDGNFIAHCIPGEKPSLKDIYLPGSDALILIGPEGDFTPDEVRLALENGFRDITLGTSRLRTETAGVVACHTINFLNM